MLSMLLMYQGGTTKFGISYICFLYLCRQIKTGCGSPVNLEGCTEISVDVSDLDYFMKVLPPI